MISLAIPACNLPLMADSSSWLSISSISHFSIANIPLGIITTKVDSEPHVAIAIGDHALDLKVFAAGDGFSACNEIRQHLDVFSVPILNAFVEQGRPIHRIVRRYLQQVFANDTPWPHILKANDELRSCRAVLPGRRQHAFTYCGGNPITLYLVTGSDT